MVKLTLEEFVHRANELHNNKYDYSKTIYDTALKHTTIICPIHGEFKQAPAKHLMGRGCRSCGIAERTEALTKTTEQFIEEAKEVHNDLYSYDKTIYKSCRSSIIVTCKIHGDFETRTVHHLKGGGCPQCTKLNTIIKLRSNTDEFIEKAQKVHGDKYDYNLVEYTTTKTKVQIVCKHHGVFQQAPTKHLSGYGCPYCRHKRSEDTIVTTKELINASKEKYGDLFLYDRTEFINSNTRSIFTCRIHGDFEQKLDTHFRGAGCPECKREGKFKQFLIKAEEKYGKYYDYSEVVFKDMRTPVTIICPKHGEFVRTPSVHILRYGCPECGKLKGAKTRTKSHDVFIEQIMEVHKGFYDYSLVNYTHSNHKIEVICPIHGVFSQKANSHLQGDGCPTCGMARFWGTSGSSGILYYIKILRDGKAYYKIGVTKYDVKRRYKDEKNISIIQLHTEYFDEIIEAYKKEHQILRQYKQHTTDDLVLDCGGNSEVFDVDVLNLDKL